MEDEIERIRDALKSPLPIPEQKKKIVLPNLNKRLCFVITKNKSNSWVDDLYSCGHLADLNRVYH
jgi:hypothetical protein